MNVLLSVEPKNEARLTINKCIENSNSRTLLVDICIWIDTIVMSGSQDEVKGHDVSLFFEENQSSENIRMIHKEALKQLNKSNNLEIGTTINFHKGLDDLLISTLKTQKGFISTDRENQTIVTVPKNRNPTETLIIKSIEKTNSYKIFGF